jgi:hemoglobin
MRRRAWVRIGAAALGLVLAACATGPLHFLWRGQHDGEVPPPADYRSWPRFRSAVDRPDVGQVREIYVNPLGAGTRRGQPFPDGTIFVMEIYAARLHADGAPAFDPSGRYVKGPLQKLFVMAKGEGWGAAVEPAALRTGDWVYSAWAPDGRTPTDDAAAGCRGCHLPLAREDFVHRVDP